MNGKGKANDPKDDDRPLFDDSELGGAPDATDSTSANPDSQQASPTDEGTGSVTSASESTGAVESDMGDSPTSSASAASVDASADPASTEIDPEHLQALADQVSSLDDESFSALVRAMPDESRESFCSVVAGTLSDQQLAKCGLSKAVDMGEMGGATQGDDGPIESLPSAATGDQDSALQTAMNKAKPEPMPGSMNMSQAAATDNATHPHSKKLAELYGQQWLDRAKAVHAKNPKAITAHMLEQYEAHLQGSKNLSLLADDHGELKPITLQIATAERMVSDDDSDLTEIQTLNMSLAGAESGKGGAKPVKPDSRNSSGYDAKEAEKYADERWSGSGNKQSKVMCA